MDEREERIRELAYKLWEEAGAPEGRAEDFWFAAERTIEPEAAANAAPEVAVAPPPVAKPVPVSAPAPGRIAKVA